jgi:hypothetical protein
MRLLRRTLCLSSLCIKFLQRVKKRKLFDKQQMSSCCTSMSLCSWLVPHTCWWLLSKPWPFHRLQWFKCRLKNDFSWPVSTVIAKLKIWQKIGVDWLICLLSCLCLILVHVSDEKIEILLQSLLYCSAYFLVFPSLPCKIYQIPRVQWTLGVWKFIFIPFIEVKATHFCIPLIQIPSCTMDESLSLADTLKCLTMKDIRETLPQDTFSSAEKRSCAKLDTAVWNLSGAHHIALEEAA